MIFEFLTGDVQKVLLSAVFGAVIGLEREWSGKAAGFRTMMLVSIGATLFTIVSFNMAVLDFKHNSDVTRIASNIATGIGFIGGGIIFRGDKSVHGLTTAASVWAAAAIGMAVGIGDYTLATVTTVIVWGVLVVFYHITKGVEFLIETKEYHLIVTHAPVSSMPDLHEFCNSKRCRMVKSKVMKQGDTLVLDWTVRASRSLHKEAITKMIADERVLQLRY